MEGVHRITNQLTISSRKKELTISHLANDTINTHTSTENLHICLENAVLLFHKSEWLDKTQSKGSIVKEGKNVAALICNQKAEVSSHMLGECGLTISQI